MRNRILSCCGFGHVFLMAIFLIPFMVPTPVSGQPSGISTDSVKTEKIFFAEWLGIPVQTIASPLFSEQNNLKNKPYSDEELLRFETVPAKELQPGLHQTNPTSKDVIWEKAISDSSGVIIASRPNDTPGIAWLATWIHTDRWLTGSLEIKGAMMFSVWLDGTKLGDKVRIGTDDKPGEFTQGLKLEQGAHLLLIKVVLPAKYSFTPRLAGTFEVKAPFGKGNIMVSTDPTNIKNIHHILDGLKITGMELSADGRYSLVQYRQSLPPSDASETWSEIIETQSHKLIYSFRNARVWNVDWLPSSDRISYIAGQNEKSTIYLLDFEKGNIVPLLQDVEKLSGYRWSPDERFLIYTLWEEPEKKEEVMRKVDGMPDRQPGWRNRSFLYKYDVGTGTRTRLTWGNQSTYLADISPDGSKMLFSQSYPDFSERPYSRQNLFIMDLKSYRLDTIQYEDLWGVSARFSPDGKYLLATGGPSSFGGAGLNLSPMKIPHNSDIQIFLYKISDKSLKCLSLNFNPSVEDVFWHPLDQQIYVVAIDQDQRKLFRLEMPAEKFVPIETGVEYLTSISFASKSQWVIYQGNQANHWPCWYTINLKNLKYGIYQDPEAKNYREVALGEVKNWDFTASTGVKVTGRVYYPPGFDSTAKYPVIVYYYGGITPVGRTFGGRYPFNIWAGHGYLVYVLQPSGAIGFGQEFSSAHVNNWGTTVADEIIEGTKQFLEAHPYADKARVGCAGASYGGFMTMLLLTRTDIFAAAVAHAGISSISSYWGEGYWGYSYSAGASANSFPWNNQELYVGQSPLFHADKIHTPLLLTHGDEDTNVPPGESIQMYTALKLLQRPVELVLVKGENHHIITYSKRILWHNTIMAWWDKQLKDQPEWWEELYPGK
jgi:dipeptidyl aminopeptidase/acylaminoacyl peptidase